MNAIDYKSIHIGQTFTLIEKEPITRVQLVKYAGASGDFNSLHLVEDVGEEVGTGIIAHGMLVMGMISEGITTLIPRKYVRRLNVRFQKMTYPGESIRVVGSIIEKKKNNIIVGEVQAVNQENDIKVKGQFECVLP
ncbi:MaoC/PaaZ C-terminal domain-containing protein [Salicibibacter kimchii]|uniref:3-hydroxyacyl-ACP dehydratase n=1 Tax=Salicibibacter kimchii TaxID=2099786 RepID=A0A345BW34_9BACI|nr:MaoC/PaaZ C-terminal domain-containing protein [Salicibibacter kimchii]AXF55165.1 3-hydroxyacyl-ACP dehydratase [Salicibibacter kimchii]